MFQFKEFRFSISLKIKNNFFAPTRSSRLLLKIFIENMNLFKYFLQNNYKWNQFIKNAILKILY